MKGVQPFNPVCMENREVQSFYAACMENRVHPGLAAHTVASLGDGMQRLGRGAIYVSAITCLYALHHLLSTYVNIPPGTGSRNALMAMQHIKKSDLFNLIGAAGILVGHVVKDSGKLLSSRKAQCTVGNWVNEGSTKIQQLWQKS